VKPELTAAFNDQITRELASSHQYLSMAAWLEARSFPGMGHWMRLQADEERVHALRFFRFVLDRNEEVSLGALPAPDGEFAAPLDVFRRSLEAEEAVTASINGLYALATELGDYASLPLLDWFVNEQVEEEASVQQIIDDLERAGREGHALLMIDRELGARVSVVE